MPAAEAIRHEPQGPPPLRAVVLTMSPDDARHLRNTLDRWAHPESPSDNIRAVLSDILDDKVLHRSGRGTTPILDGR